MDPNNKCTGCMLAGTAKYAIMIPENADINKLIAKGIK